MRHEITHREVVVNGLRMHLAEAGAGPLVLLLHGFPESWYSWRHQLGALAAAGYHAVAPDQRGYGRTDAPHEVAKYSIVHLVGDVVALLNALGVDAAVLVGHDWGAPVAWHTAQLRPDRVRGVVGLSVSHRPRGSRPPVAAIPEALGENYYLLYFQRQGIADAELARDPRETLRRLLVGLSGAVPAVYPVIPQGGGFLDLFEVPAQLPPWLTEADLDVFATDYARTGFTGGLNWYRNMDRNWELTAAWHDAPVRAPALYVAGKRDLVVNAPGSRDLIAALPRYVPSLRGSVLLPNCGHWTQQECPDEVNKLILEFLTTLA